MITHLVLSYTQEQPDTAILFHRLDKALLKCVSKITVEPLNVVKEKVNCLNDGMKLLRCDGQTLRKMEHITLFSFKGTVSFHLLLLEFCKSPLGILSLIYNLNLSQSNYLLNSMT